MISSLLVEAAIRSVLLALAVWISLRVFRVRNVTAQKATWGLVLAAAVAMPIVLPMTSHWSVLPANVRVVIPADPQTLLEELQARIHATPSQELKPSAESPSPEAGAVPDYAIADELVTERSGKPAAAPLETDSDDSGAVESAWPEPQADTAAMGHRAVPQFAAASILTDVLLVYLAVAGALLIRLLCGLMMALRVWRAAKPIPDESLISATAGSLDLACNGEVRCSAAVASPVTICSAVILPANYKTWDNEKLRVVLAHERSHIRQGDFYLQLFAGIYAAVVWFSPLGWWLKRKLSDLAEAISDRAGLEEAADRASYAQILLEFAAAPRPTLIGVAMARNGSISRRIERLLNDVSFRQAFGGTRRALVPVLVIPIALFAATALVRVEAAGQGTEVDSPQAVLPVTGVVRPDFAPAPAGGQSEPQPTPAPPAKPAAPANPVVPAAPGSPEVAPAAPSSGVLAPPGVPQAPAAPDAAPVAPPHAPANCQDRLDVKPAPPAHAPKALAVPRVMMLPRKPGQAFLLVAPKAGVASRMMVLPRLAGVPNHAMLALVAPSAVFGEGRGIGIGQSSTTERGTSSYSANGKHSGYHYWFSTDGDSYAVVRGNDTQHMSFSGNWVAGRRDEIEKARKQAGGKDFLWFTHDGKSYLLDDPNTVAQIEAMYKPMEELGRQQEELGKKQEALGKQQEELGRQQEAASVPTPDMSKQIAEIDEAMAKLKASQGKNMTQEQFADIQEKLGELQGKLGEIQGEIGSKQGEFGSRMGELGEKMGELGAQQGELGERQGRIAEAADQKVKSIIDESLKNGKAKPVQ